MIHSLLNAFTCFPVWILFLGKKAREVSSSTFYGQKTLVDDRWRTGQGLPGREAV